MVAILTERDLLLFKGLFEHRVLDIQEIAKSYFPHADLSTVRKRLFVLSSAGYLKKGAVIRGNGRFVIYSLNKTGVEFLDQSYPYEIEEKNVRSNSIEHDIELFRIRKIISSLEVVRKYFTENMLQSCQELQDSNIFSAFKDLRSDAALELNNNGKRHYCSIEFEMSDKSLGRYREKLSDYYSRNEIDSVLYICTTNRLIKNIGKINLEFCKEAKSKVHFVGVKEFYQNPKEVISKLLIHSRIV
jgi:hypothetical protein